MSGDRPAKAETPSGVVAVSPVWPEAMRSLFLAAECADSPVARSTSNVWTCRRSIAVGGEKRGRA